MSSIQTCCNITIHAKKQFEFIIGISSLKLCNEFEQKLNEIMKEFHVLKDECIESNENEHVYSNEVGVARCKYIRDCMFELCKQRNTIRLMNR